MREPVQRERLMNDRTLMNSTIEEILRWASPITHVMRTAKRGVELRGQTIREGDYVVLWNPSANRDEEVFSDPYRLDIVHQPNDHIAFGYGEHFRIGSHLARLEMRVMIDELLRRMPDMAAAGPVERLRSNLVAGIKHLPITFTPPRPPRSSDSRDGESR